YGAPEPGDTKKSLTTSPNEQTRACRDTWVKDFSHFQNVTVKFVYNKYLDYHNRQPLQGEMFVDDNDDHGPLTQNTPGLYKYAYDRGFEFVFTCDTLTWVFADRLLTEIMRYHCHDDGYCCAKLCGSGYLLCRNTCRIVAENEATLRHEYAEDLRVNSVLGAAAAIPITLPAQSCDDSGFFFGSPEKFTPSLIPDDIVAAHAVFPEQMRAWH